MKKYDYFIQLQQALKCISNAFNSPIMYYSEFSLDDNKLVSVTACTKSHKLATWYARNNHVELVLEGVEYD